MLRLVTGFMLLFPGLAFAQTVKREDVVGHWKGAVQYTIPPFARKGTDWMGLYADGLWAHWDDKDMVSTPGDSFPGPYVNSPFVGRIPAQLQGKPMYTNNHGSGRWRLTGDTLWLVDDDRYGNGALYSRLLEDPTMDTLKMPGYPKHDSLFWKKDLKRDNRHRVLVYKVSKSEKGQLVLVRLDGLSDDLWSFPKGVYERAPFQPRPKN